MRLSRDAKWIARDLRALRDLVNSERLFFDEQPQ
jgi:hypothetical protein